MTTSFWHTISLNGHRSRAGGQGFGPLQRTGIDTISGRTLVQATRSINGQLGDMRHDRFAVLKPNDGHSRADANAPCWPMTHIHELPEQSLNGNILGGLSLVLQMPPTPMHPSWQNPAAHPTRWYF
jgi:hypothetical protein